MKLQRFNVLDMSNDNLIVVSAYDALDALNKAYLDRYGFIAAKNATFRSTEKAWFLGDMPHVLGVCRY